MDKVKQVISKTVGIPASILAVLSSNSEEMLWLPVLCMSVVLAILVWNGYYDSSLKNLKEWIGRVA